MAYDSNPNAIFHGKGNPTMVRIDSSTFAFTAGNSYTANQLEAHANSDGAVHRRELQGRGLIFVSIAVGNGGPRELATFLADDILGVDNATEGDARDDDNAVTFRYDAVTIGIGFGPSGNVMASSSNATLGNAKLTFYRMS